MTPLGETDQALWLTFANAFLPPMKAGILTAFQDHLADDIEELCAAAGMDVGGTLTALRDSLVHLASDEELLVDYSHLFLQPPIPATLNLGRYVDGALYGACLDALENAYRMVGIEKRDALQDLCDHTAMQMETLAWLIGQPQDAMPLCAEDFAQICLVGALPRFARSVVAESPRSPYAALAQIAAMAIARYGAQSVAASSQTRTSSRHDRGLGVWRHCLKCGSPIAREKELEIMSRALTQAGLPTEHLKLCPGCRGTADLLRQRTTN